MSLLPFHALGMGIAFITMMSAIIIARFYKSKKWWLKAHKTLNIIAVCCAIVGFIAGFIMVQSTGGPHIRVRHAAFGLATLTLLIIMPFLGQSIFKSKDKKKIASRKKVHRIAGRITALMVTLTVVFGLSVAGIL